LKKALAKVIEEDILLSKKKLAPKVGEVYAAVFPNEYWFALVILDEDVTDKSYLVYTTAYYDLKPPSVEDPRLTEFFYSKDVYSDGKKPSIYWISGKPDESYHLIGEIDLQEKSDIKASAYHHGKWKSYIPRELLREKDPSAISKITQTKPSKHQADELPDEMFWSLIELIDMRKKNPMRGLIEKLKESPVEIIYSFEETLSHKLFQLDTPEHAGQSEEYLSPDVFLYARCAVVANGRDFYEMVLKNASPIDLEDDAEELLEVASEAYEKKTDEPFDYVSTYDYETYSNKSAWEKDV
jgi:hypothetical protein